MRTLNLNSNRYLPLNYYVRLLFKFFLTIFSYFYFLSFIIQTMCFIVAHENEFQLLFQKFAFATDIAIPI